MKLEILLLAPSTLGPHAHLRLTLRPDTFSLDDSSEGQDQRSISSKNVLPLKSFEDQLLFLKGPWEPLGNLGTPAHPWGPVKVPRKLEVRISLALNPKDSGETQLGLRTP